MDTLPPLLLGPFLLVACGPAATPAAGAAPTERPPNVLFIGIDDLNDWVGVLGGHPQARTPNLDRLASEGQLFTRAYCSAPSCNPSRVSLLTGLGPSTTGIYSNKQPFRPGHPDVVTLPQAFRAAGYEVIGAGKIFHDRFPDPASWERYFPSLEEQRPRELMPARTPANGWDDGGGLDWAALSEPDAATGDGQVADWVSAELSKPHERPFFLACGLFRPHLPWYVPAAYFEAFPREGIVLPEVPADDLDDLPATALRLVSYNDHHARLLERGQWPDAVQAYLACIAFADAQLGRVLEALEAGPHADDTIVVLWSDHGWHLGEKQHWRKFTLWEEVARVPLVVRVPGLTEAGARCGRTVSLLDLYPTLLELAGLPPRPELEGLSLVPLLRDPDALRERPALTTHRRHHAVRSERWRYIRYDDGGEELYDHDADPGEWTNLAGDPELAEIKTALGRWMPAEVAEPVPDAAD